MAKSKAELALDAMIKKYEKATAKISFEKRGESGRAVTMVKRHPQTPGGRKCERCGGTHTLAQHRSHGEGAFARIHGGAGLVPKRKLSAADERLAQAMAREAAAKRSKGKGKGPKPKAEGPWPKSAEGALAKELAKVQGAVQAKKEEGNAAQVMEDLKTQLRMARAELKASKK